MATAHVGDAGAPLELLLHALESRNPAAHEVHAVARPEEALGAAEQPAVVLVPAHPLAASECLEDLLFVGEQGGDQVVCAQDVEGAVFVGQRQRLLVGQRVAVAGRVVGDVSAGGLVAKPLAHVALGRPRTLGHLLASSAAPRPAMALYSPSFSPIMNSGALDNRAHIHDRLPHESFKLAFVNLRRAHRGLPAPVAR